MNYIKSLMQREDEHIDEIKKIKYTIEQLENLLEETISNRYREHQMSFNLTSNVFEYPHQYYKHYLQKYRLDNDIKEIKNIIKIEHERLEKQRNCLNDISKEKKLLNNIDIDAMTYI